MTQMAWAFDCTKYHACDILFKGFLRYKTITSQNVPSEAHFEKFYFVEKLCSVHKIFKFLYF